MKGATPTDPATWFEEEYQKKPTYSIILDVLSSTSDERKGILRPFFEPTEEEREQKIKTPSAAHHAIAALVRIGIVRVIITTNFDRLLEQALQDEGIQPTVIWHEDMIEGATPYVHDQCTLLKINGDYLDTRLKNTPDELATYPEKVSLLLSRIFDEYGLIVSGWLAEDDAGLRKLLYIRGYPKTLHTISVHATMTNPRNDCSSRS